MAGRPEFETVVAQAPKKSLVNNLQTKSTSIAAGGNESVYIYAPPGYVGRMVSAYLVALKPTGAASGAHTMSMSYTSSGSICNGTSDYNNDIVFDFGNFVVANLVKTPSDVASQGNAMRGVVFDNVTGLWLQYANNTNVSNSNTRNYGVVFQKEQVAT